MTFALPQGCDALAHSKRHGRVRDGRQSAIHSSGLRLIAAAFNAKRRDARGKCIGRMPSRFERGAPRAPGTSQP
jgi:hypothetical protein